MSLEQAFNPLNRQIRKPNYSQLPVTYGKQFGYEHQIDGDSSFSDLYPVTLVIDSQDRNTDKEEPGHYTVHLNETLKNIHSIELTGGKLPNPCYNITSFNNRLSFQETEEQIESNQFLTVSVPPGDYSPSALANTLGELMSEVGNSNYQVRVDNTTKKFTFRSDDSAGTGIFNLLFTDRCEYLGDHSFIDQPMISQDCRGKSIKFDVKNIRVGNQKQVYSKNSIGKLMGFKAHNLFGQLSYTSHYVYNLNPFGYLALFINDYDRVHSVNNHVNNAFCIIPLDDKTSTFDVDTRDVDNSRYIKHFYPPIKEVNRFTIKFVDSSGNVFDFNGQDNLLVLEIACSFGQPILRSNRPREPPKWESENK
jgi:hypothetical protein